MLLLFCATALCEASRAELFLSIFFPWFFAFSSHALLMFSSFFPPPPPCVSVFPLVSPPAYLFVFVTALLISCFLYFQKKLSFYSFVVFFCMLLSYMFFTSLFLLMLSSTSFLVHYIPMYAVVIYFFFMSFFC